MAMSFNAGFIIGSDEPIDSRFLVTREEMEEIATQRPDFWPEYYFCICKDDGKFYVYHRNAAGTEGSFKPYEDVFDFLGALNANLKDLSGMVADEDGFGLNINEDHLKIDENNKLDLNITLIQAI